MLCNKKDREKREEKNQQGKASLFLGACITGPGYRILVFEAKRGRIEKAIEIMKKAGFPRGQVSIMGNIT
ncbi:MAG: hypothetical protein WBB08_08930 [Halobacteriota archaeon]